jgi:hypothetical protein
MKPIQPRVWTREQKWTTYRLCNAHFCHCEAHVLLPSQSPQGIAIGLHCPRPDFLERSWNPIHGTTIRFQRLTMYHTDFCCPTGPPCGLKIYALRSIVFRYLKRIPIIASDHLLGVPYYGKLEISLMVFLPWSVSAKKVYIPCLTYLVSIFGYLGLHFLLIILSLLLTCSC